MVSIQLLAVLVSFMILDARFSLYYSNSEWESKSTFDCLYAYIFDYAIDENVRQTANLNLIPYCQRFDHSVEQQQLSVSLYTNVKNNITFAELYRKGVTSEQLLDWSASIDVAERYEKNGENSNEIFHNCSFPWFGSTCQYRLVNGTSSTFTDVVQFNFEKRFMTRSTINLNTSICYPFLTDCYRGPSPMCLEWREICDGIVDCIHGEDEQLCQILEVNECHDNEYRCHFGGQCIPSTFVRDGTNNIDCLDGSDEIDLIETPFSYEKTRCYSSPTFRCEEYRSRRPLNFPCGDGDICHHLIPQWGVWCINLRDRKMTSAMFSSLDYISNLNCRQILSCLLRLYLFDDMFPEQSRDLCQKIVNHCSLKWLVWPEYPILYGFFQFVYLNNQSIPVFEKNIMPDYLCFNASYCPALIFCTEDIGINNGFNCCRTNSLKNDTVWRWDENFYIIFKDLILQCLTMGTDQACSHPSLFHCSRSSKCISKHRLNDGENDCYFAEDELYSACQLNDSWRFTCESETNKCLSIIAVENGKQDCCNGEDEWNEYQHQLFKGNIPFGLFCNGKNDLKWTDISNETDETHCEWWPCNNPYVQCDHFWHCLNGIDELNCPETECTFNEHLCRSRIHDEDYCIPIFHLTEQYSYWNTFLVSRRIYLYNDSYKDSINYFQWNETKCITSAHISLYQPLLPMAHEDVCLIQTKMPRAFQIATVVMKAISHDFLCMLVGDNSWIPEPKTYLRTSRLGYFPSALSSVDVRQAAQLDRKTVISSPSIQDVWYCNRGIAMLFETNKTLKCLCPPTYFGDRCQWQNQRISLTFQLVYHTTKFGISVFQVIIMLIDEQRQITSYHEQITYVPKRDCGTKFNIYLLYPYQPKNSSTNYSIHIDVFDKITLTYWASWHLSIPFQFLPVNRIATRLFIPNIQQLKSCPLSCGTHGRCIRYINKNFLYFCQCDQGYSGLQCDIQQNCSCSSDSFCHTPSICICPLHKYGPHCYLKHSICQSSNNICVNDGLCVPNDDRSDSNKSTCLCQESFYGIRCENIKNRISIKFNEEIIRGIKTIFIHYITAFENATHQRITTLKKIKYNENTITLYVTNPFHILMAELFNKTYYLLVLREKFIESEYIQTELISNQRCASIHDLLNKTFLSYSRLHRIKYYPLVCRQYQQLRCFYDEYYMCICDLDRFSNCFIFEHNQSYDCQGYSDCKNGGQCFQDSVTCSSVSVCVCPDCYYGTKCQFSTRSFILSLDYILGYHIKPNISFLRQPLIVKMSVAFTTIIFTFGLINGILSILTFRLKKTRDTGCGFYLLVSSWISISVVIVLIIKFWQLVLSQMAILTNRLFLISNCILLDMILQVLLASNDWLYGCVSIERIFTVIKSVNFNKFKSKQIAKWIISSIILFILITHIHIPLHRHLIDDIDNDEQRIWCLVQYSSSINIFNTFITLVHFLIPFIINLTSIIFIIILIARSRLVLQPKISFKKHLILQLKQNKHHLIASCVLVFLAVPRLIISFITGCMKSPSNSWLFLFGYLISFLPSMMTFIAYVLPSKLYTDAFKIVIKQIIQRFIIHIN
ncbi:unnamed protein product [Rotaria sp. Silwood2]|nr:unnamed protein product [Rotaria sp. Silwood2]